MISDPASHSAVFAPIIHGGNLAAARHLFPGAPEPLIDLSTGINPHPYPVRDLPLEAFTRLPEPDSIRRLEALAAERFGAPSAEHVVAAPGTQILLPMVASLVAPGCARVLGPTYAEHIRAARLAGHESCEVHSVEALVDAALAVLVNPNNPDGRLLSPAALRALAVRTAARDGMLVVDEAFMDVAAPGSSVASETDREGLVVLRSFGKFHGLAGIRLGFGVANPQTAARLRAQLGPWAVSGPAVAIGLQARADADWAERMRGRLEVDAERLDKLLTGSGMMLLGGTPLFRLFRGSRELSTVLGRAGIMVRHFPLSLGHFRFGLPPDESAWTRLRLALMA